MQDPYLPPGITDRDTDNDLCFKCGADSLDDEGEVLHWSTCPTLKDNDDYNEDD